MKPVHVKHWSHGGLSVWADSLAITFSTTFLGEAIISGRGEDMRAVADAILAALGPVRDSIGSQGVPPDPADLSADIDADSTGNAGVHSVQGVQ